MKAFSVEDVRAVLNSAERPLSTVEVARLCRRAAGRPERVAEPKEARYALDRLVIAGEAVRAREGSGGGYTAMVPADHHGQRYWATCRVADQAVDEARRVGAAWDDVDAARVELKAAWTAAGAPPVRAGLPLLAVVPNPAERRPDRRPEVAVWLTAEQVRWLAARLGDLHQ